MCAVKIKHIDKSTFENAVRQGEGVYIFKKKTCIFMDFDVKLSK